MWKSESRDSHQTRALNIAKAKRDYIWSNTAQIDYNVTSSKTEINSSSVYNNRLQSPSSWTGVSPPPWTIASGPNQDFGSSVSAQQGARCRPDFTARLVEVVDHLLTPSSLARWTLTQSRIYTAWAGRRRSRLLRRDVSWSSDDLVWKPRTFIQGFDDVRAACPWQRSVCRRWLGCN